MRWWRPNCIKKGTDSSPSLLLLKVSSTSTDAATLGVQPDTVDFVTMLVERSPELITAVGVLVVPAFLTLILRCYVRITRRSFGKDDCCLVIAGVCLESPRPRWSFLSIADVYKLLYGWQTYEMVQGALDGIGVHDALLADKPEKAMHALKVPGHAASTARPAY